MNAEAPVLRPGRILAGSFQAPILFPGFLFQQLARVHYEVTIASEIITAMRCALESSAGGIALASTTPTLEIKKPFPVLYELRARRGRLGRLLRRRRGGVARGHSRRDVRDRRLYRDHQHLIL